MAAKGETQAHCAHGNRPNTFKRKRRIVERKTSASSSDAQLTETATEIKQANKWIANETN